LEAFRIYPGYSELGEGECQVNGIPAPCSLAKGWDALNWNVGGAGGRFGTSSNAATPLGLQWIGGNWPPGPVPIDLAPDFVGWLAERGIWWVPDNLSAFDREYDQERSQQMHVLPLGNLAQNVENILAGNCGKFVKSLYETVAGNNRSSNESRSKDFNLLEVFKTINERDGAIIFKQAIVGGRPAGGTASGAIGHPTHPATITISPLPPYNVITPAARSWGQWSYAVTAIHETFHLAGTSGGYSDEQMARAIYDLTGAPGLPDKGADVREWSRYWDNVLRAKCPEKGDSK
jgi:hypothetical protein